MSRAKDSRNSWYDWARERTDPAHASQKPEALADLLVLDVSAGQMGGPVCSSMLAELGAQVIRIEPPGGDVTRNFGPFGARHRDTGLGYLVEGRNKYHITLDLEKAESPEIFTTLAKHADVVIETRRPGVMDGWGIGYRQLREVNPRLIYAALGAYGQFGPGAGSGRPSSEITNQAYSGLVQINGEPDHGEPTEYGVPTKVGSWYGWYAEGLFAAYGILLALNFRSGTGKGQMVDVSGAECMMKFIDYNLSWFHMDGKVISRWRRARSRCWRPPSCLASFSSATKLNKPAVVIPLYAAGGALEMGRGIGLSTASAPLVVVIRPKTGRVRRRGGSVGLDWVFRRNRRAPRAEGGACCTPCSIGWLRTAASPAEPPPPRRLPGLLRRTAARPARPASGARRARAGGDRL